MRDAITQRFSTKKLRRKATKASVPWWRALWPIRERPARLHGPMLLRGSLLKILVTRAADQMTDEQQPLLDRFINQCPEVTDLRRTVSAFRAVLTSGNSNQLRQWIEGAKRSEFGRIVRFADGLQEDISAVAAPMEMPWSKADWREPCPRTSSDFRKAAPPPRLQSLPSPGVHRTG